MVCKDIVISRGRFYEYLDYPFITTDLNAYRITTSVKGAASIAVTAQRSDGSTVSCIDTAQNGCVLKQDIYSIAGEVKLLVSISDKNGSIVTECQIVGFVITGFDAQEIAGDQNTSSLAVIAYDTAVKTKELSEKLQEEKADKAETYSKDEVNGIIKNIAGHTHTNKDVLDTITAEKTDKWDSYENTISKEKTANAQKFSELEALLSTKADGSETENKLEEKANKADTYTKEEIDVPLRTFSSEAEFARLTAQQNKADIQTLREDITISSEYIRNHDTEIRNLGEGKADKADTYTKSEVYSQEETDSKLKATYTWQLIGEAKLSEDSTKISVDLGSPVTKWYSETMLLIETPVSSSLNSKNGDVTITADKANGTKQCYIFDVSSTSESYGAMNPAWKNRWAVITQWINCKPICTNVSRSRASGRAYSLSAMSSTTFHESATITDAQYITLSGDEWTFPAGTTMKLYGRFGQ